MNVFFKKPVPRELVVEFDPKFNKLILRTKDCKEGYFVFKIDKDMKDFEKVSKEYIKSYKKYYRQSFFSYLKDLYILYLKKR